MLVRPRPLIGSAAAALALVATALVAGPPSANADDPSAPTVQTIVVDPASGGRTFDGIGAISGGGGTSRLLVDYPEPQRSQVLDYLFKPGVGAELDIFKVEIGGDTHTSNGAEPSHEREDGVIDCNRGYNWWMMREAKKRNPDIVLYGLAWGAPGWFDYHSADGMRYMIDYLDCAKQHHLQIDYLGGRNERNLEPGYFIDLRAALNANGYQDVKIVAADEAGFGVVSELKQDAAFREAVDVVGIHYPCSVTRCTPNQDAKDLGLPLWASESGWNHYLTGAKRLGSEINHQYVDSRMTAFINWPVSYSWYPTVQYQNSGLLKANEPWSGYYDVGTSLWTVAQTSQFTAPGWQYVDSASTYLAGNVGTVATLQDPETGDWSAVIETTAATTPQTLRFEVGTGLQTAALQKWSTELENPDPTTWFAHDPAADPVVTDGAFEVTVQPNSVTTVSTVAGHKTVTTTPPSAPQPYFSQSFNGFEKGVSPTWFSDMEGAFETAKCPVAPAAAGSGDKPQGKCLSQVISSKPNVWMRTPYPVTLVGDITWDDYTVGTDVLLQDAGQVALAGRIVNEYNSTKLPRWNTWMGYYVWLGRDGAWRLEVNLPQDSVNKGATKVLASGTGAGFDPDVWHRVKLDFDGDAITAVLDGHDLATVHDATYAAGQTGFAVDTWARATFEDYAATPHA